MNLPQYSLFNYARSYSTLSLTRRFPLKRTEGNAKRRVILLAQGVTCGELVVIQEVADSGSAAGGSEGDRGVLPSDQYGSHLRVIGVIGKREVW